ncbi:MAG: helix-turn-helix transcriptional regulator [Actinobacteria bacterium]|nr:helix-turn-helix transcriptional regulator [Actinomycetota bacterium]
MSDVVLAVHDGEDELAMWMCRFPVGERGGWGEHYHRQHQITWVSQGLSTAIIDGRSWTVSPNRAVWIPGGMAHDVVNRGDAVLHCFYIWPEQCPSAWDEPVDLTVSALARELMLSLGAPGTERAVWEATATVLFAELERASRSRPPLPMPLDERAAELARALVDRPADQATLGQWARRLATSASTLRRAFVVDTGLTFSEWRTRARLEASLPLLAAQMSVERVAAHVGFASRSGFTEAFQRQFGHSAATYRRRVAGFSANGRVER